jgi:hypothetical protein
LGDRRPPAFTESYGGQAGRRKLAAKRNRLIYKKKMLFPISTCLENILLQMD